MHPGRQWYAVLDVFGLLVEVLAERRDVYAPATQHGSKWRTRRGHARRYVGAQLAVLDFLHALFHLAQPVGVKLRHFADGLILTVVTIILTEREHTRHRLTVDCIARLRLLSHESLSRIVTKRSALIYDLSIY